MTQLQHPLLSVALEAASKGAKIVRDYYYAGVAIQSKGNSELVSVADLEAETSIIETIRHHHPTHSVMAEETMQTTSECDDLWVVDPLDGTNNFAHGLPHFAVSIGYFRRGKAEVGVIVQPLTQEWYITVAGQGAWHWNPLAPEPNGMVCRVSGANELNRAMVALGFYYDRGAMMEATLSTAADFFRKNIHGVRRFGAASLDLAMLACGRFDCYFEFQLSPWDHAAGKLLVEEAGGTVTDCHGKPLPLATKSSILASNGLLHRDSLAIAQPHWERYLSQAKL